MFWLVGWAITSFFRSRSALIAENLCLRHQLLVLQRRHPRPRLRNADRRFWILACRWLTGSGSAPRSKRSGFISRTPSGNVLKSRL